MCDMEVEGTSRKQSLCLYTIHQQRVPQKEPDRSKEKDGGVSLKDQAIYPSNLLLYL